MGSYKHEADLDHPSRIILSYLETHWALPVLPVETHRKGFSNRTVSEATILHRFLPIGLYRQNWKGRRLGVGRPWGRQIESYRDGRT